MLRKRLHRDFKRIPYLPQQSVVAVHHEGVTALGVVFVPLAMRVL
jgi:hypothetical protein